MSLWNDTTLWTALTTGAACPICQRGKPLDLVATMAASWLTMQRDAPVVGYACLVSQIHAVELHDLSDATATTFMSDARRVSRSAVRRHRRGEDEFYTDGEFETLRDGLIAALQPT
jgi:hypothetical protein